MTFVEFAEVVRNVAISVGAGFGAYAAYHGAQSWKRQTAFSKKYEALMELLRAASWLQRAFALARQPMEQLSKEDVDEVGLNEAKKKHAAEVWNEFVPSYKRFEDALMDARIFTKDEALEEAVTEIRSAVSALSTSIHFELQGIETSDANLSQRLLEGRYNTGRENPVTRKLEDAVTRLVEQFRSDLAE